MTIEQFNFLVSEYTSKLYAIAYRLTGDRQKAEDIVQDTFVSAWKSPCYKKAEIDDWMSCAWLIKILRRRYYDAVARKPDKLVFTPRIEISIEMAQDTSEISSELQRALNKLKPEFKETFLLVAVGELTHQEVAEILKIPMGTVLSRVSRARNYLRKELMEGKRTVSSFSGKEVPLFGVVGSTPMPSAF